MCSKNIHEKYAMKKIALAVAYNGANYHGWQYQSESVKTVQGELEKALTTIAAGQPVKVHCAGRTDAKVHATAQFVHFETEQERSLKAWTEGCNTLLPKDISVQWANNVRSEFHARFSALSRRYRYFIANTPYRPALNHSTATWFRYPLNETNMHEAGQYLLGENNFQSFRGAACQSSTPFRNMTELSVIRRGDFLQIDIEANAFLLHMVRNIVGTLLEVGQGKQKPIWMKQVLEQCDRTQAGVTAAPNGLHLVEVSYPLEFSIPRFAFPVI